MTYSPNRQLHFVLVGEFRKMGKSTAEAVLKKLGAAVDSKVTANTNYLVVGAPGAGQETLDDTDAVRTAKELGIRMITEEQLASFTRY
jgi:NAD-dependent DNA ligase